MHHKHKFDGVIVTDIPSYPVQVLLEHGFVVIDKPSGPTSHQVCDFVKDILELDRAGHAGTLDPGVTGVLPVGLGKSTRLMQLFLTSPKKYVGIVHFHDDPTPEKIAFAFASQRGSVKQLPPLKSAVKREVRTREVYQLDILEIKRRDVLFEVSCQAGTYIRRICHDLGIIAGTGAHMAELRRTKAGPFTEKHLTSLPSLKDAYVAWKEHNNESLLRSIIYPPEFALSETPHVVVFPTVAPSLSHGRDVAVPGIITCDDFEVGDMVAVMSTQGNLLALGEAYLSTSQILAADKGIALKTKRVFINEIATEKQV